MAAVRQRGKKGHWSYRFAVRNGSEIDENGKERIKYKYVERGGFLTKKEAQEAGAKAEAEYYTRLTVWKPREVMFGQLLKEWELDWCHAHYKGSTLDGVRKDIKIIVEYGLGDMYIYELTPKILQDCINGLAKRKYARSRLGKIKSTMYKCLRWSVEMEMLRNNPALHIMLPAPRAALSMGCREKRELRALSREEASAIIARFEGESAYLCLLLSYRCGLRLGEAFGLELGDYNMERQLLSVRQQLGYHGSQLVVSAPKYESSRVIDVDDDSAKILERHIKRLRALESIADDNYHHYYIDNKGVVSEMPGSREFYPLMRREDSTLISPRVCQHVYRVIHGETGKFEYTDAEGIMHRCIPDATFHQMRHTHCSELLAAGYDINFVSSRLGHRDSSTTMKFYSHLLNETRTAEAERFKNFYTNQEEQCNE